MSSALTKLALTSDVRREAHMYMTKLLDRDTEAMAASQLESMARSLPTHSLPSFLSAISDTRPCDKTPLRRHCVRLLSLLSLSHPPHSLAPLLPRMLSSIIRRLRDPDSSVRSACVDSVRAITSALSPTIPSSSFLRPLSETLLLEHDLNAQTGAALCLVAAVDSLGSPHGDPERCLYLQRLLPRLVKLARTDSCKAKPAVLVLIGAVAVGGGAGIPATMGATVPCLVEFLSSEDWAARKAAADALGRVALACDPRLLVGFRAVCLANCEACKFDKVKTVRESMNQMMEMWKEVPEKVVDEGVDCGNGLGLGCIKVDINNGHPKRGYKSSNYNRSSSQSYVTKSRYSTCRSPPRDSSPAPLLRRNTPLSSEKRSSPPSLRNRSKVSGLKSEIALLQKDISKMAQEDELAKNENATRFLMEINRRLFENSFNDDVKSDYSKSGGENVDSSSKKESFGSLTGFLIDEVHKNGMEGRDFGLIQRQLVQIENQQSGLIDLLQKYIGTSQNGFRALEKRVHSLEMVLDEISHEMSSPNGKLANGDLSSNGCCRFPGTEFLSSMFSRRTDGRDSSRFSLPSSRGSPGLQGSADKPRMDSCDWDKQQYGIQGGCLINPPTDSCLRDLSDAGSEVVLKKASYVSGYSASQDCRIFDGASTSTCSSVAGILSSCKDAPISESHLANIDGHSCSGLSGFFR